MYLNYVNTPVQFILPNGSTNSVTPDPASASFETNGVQAIYYVRSANVTALVQAAGAGTYSAGGVPGTVLASEDNNNCCGWTLGVVLWQSLVAPAEPFAFRRRLVCSRRRKSSQSRRRCWFLCAAHGSGQCAFVHQRYGRRSQQTGDQMLFGPTTNSLQVLSGPNNLANNFFAGQINGDNGLLDTSGTFWFQQFSSADGCV